MKLRPVHWLLIAIGGIALLFFALLMTILIFKFLTNPPTKTGAPGEQNYITANDRYKEEVFKEFFREALESGGAFVVIDPATQEIIGSSRYFGFEPERSEIEIGWTFLARAYRGGRYNGELKRLMLDHAFRFVDSVVFIIGATNFRSQKAIEKIGGVMIGLRERETPRGKSIDHVYEMKKPTISQ